MFKPFFYLCDLFFSPHQETLSICAHFWFLSCRGNSKYHYYGIRVKPDSPLNRLQEDMQYMALRQQPVQQKQRYTGSQICIQTCNTDHIFLLSMLRCSRAISGSSRCRSLMPALGRTTQVEASTNPVQQSRRSLRRASTTSSF